MTDDTPPLARTWVVTIAQKLHVTKGGKFVEVEEDDK